MEYTPISQLKHPFGSPFNSINISLAAVNRKTQLERERKREKRRECFTTICLTLLKLEDLKLDKRKSAIFRKLREFPQKTSTNSRKCSFSLYQKLCLKGFSASKGDGQPHLMLAFPWWTWWTQNGHDFTTPFTDSKPMIQGPFFRWFWDTIRNLVSQKTLPGMMT